jgi:hypothetical protein
MKCYLLFAILFFESTTIFSQTKGYIPFVSPRNEWVADYDALIKDPANIFIRYSFSKDSTLFQGKYYRSLMSSYKETDEVKSTGTFMREAQGAIYQYDTKQNKESLIYNMNYKVGDSIAANPNLGQPSSWIQKIGVYSLLDNVPRKSYTRAFKDCPELVTIVEGIGDIQGFMMQLYCSTADGGLRSVRCFSTDGKLLYKRSDVGGCFISPTKDLVNERLKISPNPVTDILNIQYTNNQSGINVDIVVTDLSGRLVLKSVLNSNENKIDVSSFQNGFYFITFFENNRFITTKRFAKVD